MKKYISHLCEKNNLSMDELSSKMQVKINTIKDWDNGVKRPSKKQIEILSKIFEIDSNKLIKNMELYEQLENEIKVKNKCLRIGLVVSLILIVSLSLLFLKDERILKDNDRLYYFTGQSEHFNFDRGLVLLYNGKKYINMSNFIVDKNLDIKNMVINISFNERLWKSLEYHYNPKQNAQDWLKSITINEYGKKRDSFKRYKNKNFPDDFKIEINYCLQNDECHTEIMETKSSVLNSI